jgi:transcriptional regulator with XRE-family HTH domain
LDLIEGLPVVFRNARLCRGLDTVHAAARDIGISDSTVTRIETRPETVNLELLERIFEWLGPLSQEEWDALRYADLPRRELSRTELLQELEVAMTHKDDYRVVAARLQSSPAALSRRLDRMGEHRLARFFEGHNAGRCSSGPDSVRVSPYVTHLFHDNPV